MEQGGALLQDDLDSFLAETTNAQVYILLIFFSAEELLLYVREYLTQCN